MLQFVGDAGQAGFDLVQQAQDRRRVGRGDHADVGVLGGNPRHGGVAQVVVLDVEDFRRQHVFGANERRGALIDQAGRRAGRRSVGQGLFANGASEREHTPAEGAKAAMLHIGDRALCPPEAANDALGDRNELRLAGGAAGAGVHRRPFRRDDRLSGRDLPVDVRAHRFVVVNGNGPAKFFGGADAVDSRTSGRDRFPATQAGSRATRVAAPPAASRPPPSSVERWRGSPSPCRRRRPLWQWPHGASSDATGRERNGASSCPRKRRG